MNILKLKARNFITGEVIEDLGMEAIAKRVSPCTATTIKRAIRHNLLTPTGWQVTKANLEWKPVTIDSSTIVRCGRWIARSVHGTRRPLVARTLAELVILINNAYPDEYITERIISHRFSNGSNSRTGWLFTAEWGSFVVRKRNKFTERVLNSPDDMPKTSDTKIKNFKLALQHLLTH